MRIISGFAKGRKLYGPQSDKVIRPTSDRAKEALFNILGENVQSAHIVDLFAGTGAFGIEALSRGAASAAFIDNGRESLQLLERNLKILLQSLPQSDPPPFIDIIKADALKFNLQSSRLHVPLNDCDIIFMDPPYSKGFVDRVLRKLDQHSLFKSSALIIAEERSCETPPQGYNHFHLSDQRRYGDTAFWIYEITNCNPEE